MTNLHVGLERRAAQRFGLALPVCIRLADCQKEEHGFTQDLSNRGTYLYTNCALQVGANVEITLVMPSEITLSESMRVRCRGKVLRLDNTGSAMSGSESTPKLGVAVHFEHYEYLADAQAGCKEIDQYERLATLHHRSAEGDSPDSPPDRLRNAPVR
ncbi:MAG TPA: PilZ domain-containing protein [Terriglobales bacterium]|nr:PilZ domain-containing protein [Terriglobales bacterium]